MNKTRLKTDLACGLILATALFTGYAVYRAVTDRSCDPSQQNEIRMEKERAAYIEKIKKLEQDFDEEVLE